MCWHVDVLNETVAREPEALPAEMRAKYLRITGLITEFGQEHLREPYVKHLEGKLWEMRMKGRDGVARSLYVTATGKQVVVLRVFVKKTQKTPRSEIEIALQRAKEVQ